MAADPSIEEVFTIAPPRWRRIWVISARMQCHTPTRSTWSTRWNSSGGYSSSGRNGPATAALLCAASSRPYRTTVRCTAVATASRSGHVGDDRLSAGPSLPDQGQGAVEEAQPGARTGERDGAGPADAGRGPGD